MSLFRPMAGGLVCLALLTSSIRGADALPSPLRFIPDQADLLIEVKQPRRLVESVVGLDLLKQLQTIGIVREQLEGTNVRKFKQLVAYFEKELGTKWPDLLDQLAGGGVALGSKLGPNPAPSLIVIQGKDEKLLEKFVKVGLGVLEQELGRLEIKVRPVMEKYGEVETVSLGDGIHLARVGSTLLIANKMEALKLGLDLHSGKSKKSMADLAGVAEAAKLLPKDALITAWLNFETVRKFPGAADAYKTPRDPAVAVVFGSYLDVFGRTPFLCAGVAADKDGLLVTFRVRPVEGSGVEKAMHIPEGDAVGSRPLLAPRNVTFSWSFFMDLNKLWEDRAKIFGDERAKAMDEFDKNSGRFLSGNRLSKIFSDLGPYHRIVGVNQPKYGYKTTPKVATGAYAIVSEMRNPDSFYKAIEPSLRAAALLGAFSEARLKSTEEKYAGCKIVGYRFPEDKPFRADVNDIRFNFSPCFTRVGNQFVVASTIELCKEMIDVLQKEAKDQDKGSPATSQVRVFADGIADGLVAAEDTLVTQAILDQALPAEEAREQVRSLISVVRKLGSLTSSVEFGAKSFRYDIRLKMSK